MLKNLVRIVIILIFAILGIMIGEGLNSVFGGASFNFSPVTAIIFTIAASCVIICDTIENKQN